MAGLGIAPVAHDTPPRLLLVCEEGAVGLVQAKQRACRSRTMLLAAGEAPVHVAHVAGDGPAAAVGGPAEPNKGPETWAGAGTLRCRQRLELRAVIGAACLSQQLQQAPPGTRIPRTPNETYLMDQVPVEGRLTLQLEQRAHLFCVRRVLSPVHPCACVVFETGAAEHRVSSELLRRAFVCCTSGLHSPR